MSSRRLVLLRHGRTAWNHARRIQGHSDVELDEVGHEQALAAAVLVAAYRPTVLRSSDLARARQTAAYVAKETGLEPTYDARLRECGLGEREALTHAEYEALAPEEFAAFRRGEWDLVPGAEGLAVVRERITAALRDLLAELPAGGTGVAVSHGAALRLGVAGLLGWPAGAEQTLAALGNCGQVVLREVGDPDADGTVRVALERYGVTPDFASASSSG